MLKGKKILLGITGSIAAYKTISLLRLFVQAGAEVKVVITPAAKDFVSPLVLSTLSKNDVYIDISTNNSWSNHVMLGRWADVFLIAPLSCNSLSKMAAGACDNILLAIYLSATCPVVCAPAMDEDMWHHPSTKANLEKIQTYGNKLIPVSHGELASGLIGEGRMAEPSEIFSFICSALLRTDELQGKKVVITAGPTYEKLDPVRYIGNFSSGKMGFALAEEFYLRGAEVILISGPSNCTIQYPVKLIKVNSAEEMHDQTKTEFDNAAVCIMSAAVADYKPAVVSASKIKKSTGNNLDINFVRTVDILKDLGTSRKKGQLVVGFALETNNEIEYATQKLKVKNADLIVLNSLKDEGAGFAKDTNSITILDKSGIVFQSGLKSKKEIAKDIAEVTIKYL